MEHPGQSEIILGRFEEASSTKLAGIIGGGGGPEGKLASCLENNKQILSHHDQVPKRDWDCPSCVELPTIRRLDPADAGGVRAMAQPALPLKLPGAELVAPLE